MLQSIENNIHLSYKVVLFKNPIKKRVKVFADHIKSDTKTILILEMVYLTGNLEMYYDLKKI